MKKIGKFGFVDTAAGQYAVQLQAGYGGDEMSTIFRTDAGDWEADTVSIGGEHVVPWGAANNLPDAIQGLLERNNLGPGILERKVGLLYGQGAALYRLRMEEGEIVQEWTDDDEVQRWLDTWDYRAYIRAALVEYTHMQGVFVKYHAGRGVRIGKPWLSRLECLHSTECRMVAPPDIEQPTPEDIRYYLTGNFRRATGTFRRYPAFDAHNPARHETAVRYHSLRSFGRRLYALPSFYGSVPWLDNANDLPDMIRHLNENMIAAAYVVHMPQEYWNRKEQLIREMNPEWRDEEIQAELEQVRDRLMETIANVMAGRRNAGKFFACVDFIDPDGHAQKWDIEAIEMNIDKYIEAQAKISRIADSSTTSGFGLSPALANIIIDGKSDSGSQMLYALKIFYGADTQIAEEIALEALNDAIRINFPHKRGLFMGLYRKVIQKEDNVTASARTSNQV